MGIYLNGSRAYTLFRNEAAKPYFIDKSKLIEELLPLVEQGSNHVCITRPRRFGKTMAAHMISAYFSKGADSRTIFDSLYVGKNEKYSVHLNQHNVIHIPFNKLPKQCRNYQQYIRRIEDQLTEDLKEAYHDVPVRDGDAVWDILLRIHAGCNARFIFVLDEWDFIFHRDFITQRDKEDYIDFLSSLLKDQPYMELAYMTGILPIAKYSSGSELNTLSDEVRPPRRGMHYGMPFGYMFLEYTMATREKYSEYFGFTEEETDMLYERYLRLQPSPEISREGIRLWYNGYQTMSGRRLYNPRSVVGAFSDNQLGNYWTSSGPYDEIFYYIEQNVDQVRDDLARMVSGLPVAAKIQEYAAVSMNLTNRDEIFSAMVVYGFLTYRDGYVSIPNKELMDKFADMIQREPSLGYVHRLAMKSRRMLDATKAGDTAAMLDILEYAHNTESPLISYSNEAELAAIIRLVYLGARDFYQIEQEDKAGIGYVDFIFYPWKKDDDCIILELKVDYSAEDALRQIKDRGYALRFQGRLGENTPYTGRILAVGIAYYRKDKKHQCKIEILREKAK